MVLNDNSKSDNDLILVTGASGFVAVHIIKQLLELGYRVKGTVRSVKDEKKIKPLRNLVPNPRHPLELCEADLMNEKSWIDAVKGCTYVIHTASPFPNENPKDENELIKPAVNGTVYVLKACAQEDSKVKKVVLTSSIAAIAGDNFKHEYVYSEKDWPDVKTQQPYEKSKILAERAAWDFMKQYNPKFDLAVINPGYIMGPLLHDVPGTSVEVVKRLLLKEMPLLPDIVFPACDVRDVAKAHIRAMIKNEANGQRHLIVNSIDGHSFKDWAMILDKEFGNKGYDIPLKTAPNCLMKGLAIFDKQISLIKNQLGVRSKFDNSRMVNVLKIEPINIKNTLIDMSYSLIEKNIVPKKF